MTRGSANTNPIQIRGAVFDCAYLPDLTTTSTLSTGHTNYIDWVGLHARDTKNILDWAILHSNEDWEGLHGTGVPGLQIDGYFLDKHSKTTRTPDNYFGNKKYPHDSQFVIRFPNTWNGGLVITGPPGTRGQYANDFIISDFVLAKGYAFASTDKGNSGLRFYSADEEPGEAVAEWHRRVNQLTYAAKEAADIYYGNIPRCVYITGVSNGGYLTRYALENHPELYDGGVDWEGPLWLPAGPNLLTFLPFAIRTFQAYKAATSEAERSAKRQELIDEGFPTLDQDVENDSDFLWQYYYDYYWNLTQRIYRDEFDPYYPGNDAEYSYSGRINPTEQALTLVQQQAHKIKEAVSRISLTGDIKKPLITLHGTLDALLPINKSSDKYAELVEAARQSNRHRYYRIEGGTHVDSLYDYPHNIDPTKVPEPAVREKLRPILPCYRAAFNRLVKWVEKKGDPPPSTPTQGELVQNNPMDGDVLNSCPTLEEGDSGT